MARRHHDERGFTISELLVTMFIATVLMTLAAFALRHYWLVQSMYGSRDQIVTQLRRQQEQVVSENHPLVFGARFRVGSDIFGIVRYNPMTNTCTDETTIDLPGGVRVASASFLAYAGATATCRTQISGAAADQFVFFFSRGTATQGQVRIEQPALGRSLGVTVSPITGRVDPIA